MDKIDFDRFIDDITAPIEPSPETIRPPSDETIITMHEEVEIVEDDPEITRAIGREFYMAGQKPWLWV